MIPAILPRLPAGRFFTTVRQAPLTAIDSPIETSKTNGTRQRELAIAGMTSGSNVWMIDNF